MNTQEPPNVRMRRLRLVPPGLKKKYFTSIPLTYDLVGSRGHPFTEFCVMPTLFTLDEPRLSMHPKSVFSLLYFYM